MPQKYRLPAPPAGASLDWLDPRWLPIAELRTQRAAAPAGLPPLPARAGNASAAEEGPDRRGADSHRQERGVARCARGPDAPELGLRVPRAPSMPLQDARHPVLQPLG